MQDYLSQVGFLPFNICMNFIDRQLPFDTLLSGFEVYFSKYDAGMHSDEFVRLLEGSRHDMLISIDEMDSLQDLTALVFAHYLCKYCGGIFYDPQKDITASEI